MFSFENEEFERFYDQLQTPHSRYKDDMRERLRWFFECIENLTLDEVIFVLSLRSCDNSFRCAAYRTLRQYARARNEFLEMMNELGKKEVERRTSGRVRRPPRAGGRGGDKPPQNLT